MLEAPDGFLNYAAEMNATPSTDKRLSELDVLRGFAMLGVYIVNFVEMNALPPGEAGVYPESHRVLDGVVEWLYHEFFNEKFYLIFVFLFGYSLSFTAVSAKKKNMDVDVTVVRRMGSLMLIGIVLSGLCWWGVILVPYAIFGLILWVLVRVFSERINIAIAVMLVFVVSPVANHLKLAGTYEYALDTETLTAMFSRGGLANWLHLIPVQLQGTYWGFFTDGYNTQFYPGQIAYLSVLLGLFILGWYAAMRKIITKISNSGYVRVVVLGVMVFAATKFIDPRDTFYFHRLSQSLVMSACVILFSRSLESPMTRLFAIVGSTSFSAYAFHLVVGALIFFVLGYFQTFSYTELFLLALATYFIAALLCGFLQRRFQAGPLEMLMKRMTYGAGGRDG